MLDVKKLLTKILGAVGVATAEVSGSTGKLYLYRFGNVVYFSSNGAFRSKSTSISSGTTLTQKIPSGYRPVAVAYINAPQFTSNNLRLEFATNGNITFQGSAAWNSNMYISGMWVTNDAMPT